ncbi:MAG: oligosaccharide flippase family protein [Methylococcales bacterium]|nr:oligosaccharide flippase family protein [Methylococcales bacterium]
MSLKKNVFANYLGQAWTALMGLAFVPLYIKYLGMEAYGLIGIFTLLQAWLTLLDMGMTPTLSREMARYTAGAHSAQSIRDLLRTMEFICFALAIFVCGLLWLCAPWLSEHWLQTEKISAEQLAQAISVMGLVIALRFVEGVYRGAIVGLQQQVWLNVAGALLATLRSVGAVLILIWIAPTIELFFLWQGAVSVITIIAFIIATYRHLPISNHVAQFSLLQLKAIWRFASGMMAITLLSLLLTQVDKIILSRLLSLELFGYYTLAGIVASILSQLITPITQAYAPRFTELVTQDDTAGLIKSYHQSAQLISVLIIPATIILILFGKNLLLLWTGNPLLAENAAPLVALLALGTMLNGFMHIPYFLTLAYGWTKFALYQNIIAVILLVPSTIWASLHYGAIGAAWIWVILNAGYVLIAVHFLYRRLLVTEKWRWYGKDIILPTLGAGVITWLCMLVQPAVESKLIWLAWLSITGVFIVAGAWIASSKLLSVKQMD